MKTITFSRSIDSTSDLERRVDLCAPAMRELSDSDLLLVGGGSGNVIFDVPTPEVPKP
jgi:hypothetical protein